MFFSASDRALYLRLIRENLDYAGVRVLAYCLMTNHVHLVVVPEHEDSLALMFGRAGGRYSQALNIRKGRSGHLWQARYYSCGLSDRHLWTAIRYVEENPCRAGLVVHPQNYRYSSAAAHLLGTGDPSRLLDMRFWEISGGAEMWAELHREHCSEQQVRVLRKCTYSGKPFGEESFVCEMEDRFGRKWRRGLADLSEETKFLPEIGGSGVPDANSGG